MEKPNDKDVLYAFAVEDTHDRDTLVRYLQRYPDLAEDLIDLSMEIRLGDGLAGFENDDISDPKLDDCWREFLAAGPAVCCPE